MPLGPTKPCFYDESSYSYQDQFVFQTILEGKQFVDKIFPANQKSLLDPTNNNCEMANDRVKFFKTLKWKRASDLFPYPELWFTTINYENIEQGAISNCHFITVLSCLARIPGYLENLFVTTEINQAGIYAMKFFVNGHQRIVVVDDYIPYDAGIDASVYSVNPVFA